MEEGSSYFFNIVAPGKPMCCRGMSSSKEYMGSLIGLEKLLHKERKEHKVEWVGRLKDLLKN